MNRKTMLSRLALSALAVSAIASPVVANAAVPASSDQYVVAQSSSGAKGGADAAKTVAAAAVALQDPLKLAQQYAPDTVQTWKDTLDTYDKLLQSKIKVVKTEGGKSATIAVAAEGGAVKFDGKPVQLQASVKEMKAIPIDGAKAGSGQVAGTISITASTASNAVAIQAAPGGDSFFQRQIDLNKAVESKDAGEIKQALSKLLEAYKAQIAKLEQLK
ncbi:hypothetical protein [Cohnella nanjingensis]|uniref:Uncharacterized protein n=1 Tax=Cohnella nanjingensis TaxID=1387779 RepID=A0A7X0RWU0_9BACL|nr:hypothetical protein [Cohnella nanjingensis]MBB6675149.1 hypothetical protein [Cohnella nanjingensis]